jgi:hypothetical protein
LFVPVHEVTEHARGVRVHTQGKPRIMNGHPG